MTFDRTIALKRKILTPTKIHVLTTKEDSLTAFGFRAKVTTPSTHISTISIDKNMQPPIQYVEPFDTNEFKDDKLILLDSNHIRIFYMNINGLKLGQGGHSLLQLCLTLKEKDVDIVCLTEKNVHWTRTHVYRKYRQTLRDTRPKHKISFCTSESDITWNSDCNSGGTVMFTLDIVSSTVLQKGQDSSGMGRWTFLTILG